MATTKISKAAVPDLGGDSEEGEGGDANSAQTEGTKKALAACFDAMMPLGKSKTKGDDDDDDSDDDENGKRKRKGKKAKKGGQNPKRTSQAGPGIAVAIIFISDGLRSYTQADDPEKKKKEELKKAIRGSGPLLHLKSSGMLACTKKCHICDHF